MSLAAGAELGRYEIAAPCPHPTDELPLMRAVWVGVAVSFTARLEAMSAATPQQLERPEVAAFCRRWKVRELAVFGSVLRGDSRPDSDIDLLVTFDPDASWGLFDQAAMESELTSLLGRKVDLVSRRAIERSSNWIRRQAILESAETVHVAR